MAPEVDRSSSSSCSYSYSADVFSFSIVFWEVLTQKKAFDEFGLCSRQEFKNAMYRDKQRPPLNHYSCERFHDALLSGWDHDPNVRPTMQDLICRLDAELSEDVSLECWQPDEKLRRSAKFFFL